MKLERVFGVLFQYYIIKSYVFEFHNNCNSFPILLRNLRRGRATFPCNSYQGAFGEKKPAGTDGTPHIVEAWTRWGHSNSNLSNTHLQIIGSQSSSGKELRQSSVSLSLDAERNKHENHNEIASILKDISNDIDASNIRGRKFDSQYPPSPKGPMKRQKRKILPSQNKENATLLEFFTRPNNFYRNIIYDHLAADSLQAIAVPYLLPFQKGDKYLRKWWLSAKKWGILDDELKQLDSELRLTATATATVKSRNLLKSDPTFQPDTESTSTSTPLDSESVTYDYDTGIFSEIQAQVEDSVDAEEKSSGVNVASDLVSEIDDAVLSDVVLDKGHVSPAAVDIPHVPLNELYQICRRHRARVICVGDVHGCIEELRDLLREVKYRPGDLVLFLGDLVAKGPQSEQVVRLAIDIGAMSVRGNHDHEVVRQGLAFAKRNSKRKTGGGGANEVKDDKTSKMSEHLRIALQLSVKEMEWMSQLPYYIRSIDLGTLFVHAGFMNGVRLPDQDPWVMMTMRSVLPDGRMSPRYVPQYPWAVQWAGPLTAVFGHDAARGLQNYKNAIGIDTGERVLRTLPPPTFDVRRLSTLISHSGCVYGGKLSALLLPNKEIVSVPARCQYRDPK